MKARSGTKAAACSNRYATDKRGARRAQILIFVPQIIITPYFCFCKLFSAFASRCKFAQKKTVLFNKNS
jgi:hypothetical protein